jgi:hypothetical protein
MTLNRTRYRCLGIQRVDVNGGDDDGRPLSSFRDHLEEELRTDVGQRHVPDLVERDQFVLLPALRNRRHATLHLARDEEHSQAPTDLCRRVQYQSSATQDAGRGNAAGVEQQRAESHFAPFRVLHRPMRGSETTPRPFGWRSSSEPWISSRSVPLLAVLNLAHCTTGC